MEEINLNWFKKNRKGLDNYIKSTIQECDLDQLTFSDIHDAVLNNIGVINYNNQGPGFPKWITRRVKKHAADLGIAVPYYSGEKGTRAVGIKFIKPPPPSEQTLPEKETTEPIHQEPTNDELDLLTIGKAIDRYIDELKTRIKLVEEEAEISRNKFNRTVNDLTQANKDKDRTIEKLNQRIANLNNLVKSDSQKNRSATFKFSELANFK